MSEEAKTILQLVGGEVSAEAVKYVNELTGSPLATLGTSQSTQFIVDVSIDLATPF